MSNNEAKKNQQQDEESAENGETKYAGENPYFEIIEPPNRIKRKVGDGKGFPQESIRNAQIAVKELASNYINDLIYEVQDLKNAFQTFVSSEGQERIQALKKVTWYAHEIKGQGGSFGYPFVSKVARSLCFFMYKAEERGGFDDLAIEIMRAHVSTLMVIADKRIRGEGGETGKLVVEGLEVMVRKYLVRDPSFLDLDIKHYLEKLHYHMEKAGEE